MDLEIFDVEHGACALLTCDDNTRLMIDCGHNASTQWRPGTYLKQQGIAKLDLLTITNYDEDHVSGISNLLDEVDVRWLTRNGSVSSANIRELKSEDGMGVGIDRLVRAIDRTFTGDGSSPMPTFLGLERKLFCTSYPKFTDENNLSLAVLLRCHGIGVLFMGDLECAGTLELLKREDFRQALRETHVLVAPHHGRESGCCEEMFEFCSPYYVVISDKGYMHSTQETVPFYRSKAKGGPFRGETRHVLTTRRDEKINFSFDREAWRPY
tara:strand:- start:13013 stop:13816 length:804 start_codon:yes stop_codon:yes gene_type:complete